MQERCSFIKSKIVLGNVESAFLSLREIALTDLYRAIVCLWECVARHAHSTRNPLALLFSIALMSQHDLDDAVHTAHTSMTTDKRKFQQCCHCLTELHTIGDQCSQWLIQRIPACSDQIVRNSIRVQEGKE